MKMKSSFCLPFTGRGTCGTGIPSRPGPGWAGISWRALGPALASPRPGLLPAFQCRQPTTCPMLQCRLLAHHLPGPQIRNVHDGGDDTHGLREPIGKAHAHARTAGPQGWWFVGGAGTATAHRVGSGNTGPTQSRAQHAGDTTHNELAGTTHPMQRQAHSRREQPSRGYMCVRVRVRACVQRPCGLRT